MMADAKQARPAGGPAGGLVGRLVPGLPDPDAHQRVRAGQRTSLVGICCNVALAAAKAAIGMAAGSVSIVADAANNLSDASSNVVSLVGFKLASRPADEGHPYGHGRYEYLAGLVVAVLVAAVGLELVRDSVARIAHPAPTAFSLAVVVVLLLSMAVKVWMAWLNRKVGSLIASEALVATASDSRNDVIATGAVLASAVLSAQTGLSLDGWAGLAVGIFILASSVGLVRDTLNPLLGTAPSPQTIAHVREKILSYPGVLGTHDLMIHDYGPGRQFATADVEMAAEADPLATHDIIDRIERYFREHENLDMVLHYDPIVTRDPDAQDLHTQLAREVRAVDPCLTVHDVRRTTDASGETIFFDCAVPADLALSDAELTDRLVAAVSAAHPGAAVCVTLDHGFFSTGI